MSLIRPYIAYILCFTVCMCLSYNSIAQRYPFYNLNVENGLIQSQVSCIAQDKKGNLWIGTLGGLSRYDGQTFTNYSVRNGMPHNNVRSICIDSQDHVWIATPAGVSEFDGRQFKNYTVRTNTNNSVQVDAIKTGKHNTIWCVGDGKVYTIIKGEPKAFNMPVSSVISAILPDGDDLWLAALNSKIYKYHDHKWDSLQFEPQENIRVIALKIYKSNEGVVWFGTNIGLYKMDGNVLSPHYINKTALNRLPPILSITEDHNKTLWLGTNSGALHITQTAMEYYNKRNGLSNNIFNDAITDHEGNVWLASDGQGLFRFSGSQFTTLDENMGLPDAQVMGFAADRGGRLFVGTYTNGLFVYENDKVTALPFPSNPIPNITSLHIDNTGKLWIATRNRGLWSYDKDFVAYQQQDYKFPSNAISCLYADSPNRLWIGFQNGAMLHEKNTFKPIPLNNYTVYSILSIGKDSILFATNGGLKCYTNEKIIPFITNSALDSSSVQCIVLKGYELWAGTSDNGLLRYNLITKKMGTINKQNGLRSDFIYNLIIDNDGDIWAGTGYGIHKIHETNTGEVSITFYSREQGIGGMESNLNAVLKMRDGSIWFGTTNGAAHYLPHSQVITPKPVSVVMESVKVFGQDVTDSSYYDSRDNMYDVPYGLHLPHQKNNISFTFHAITLSGVEQVYYRYIIEGIDASWSNWSQVNSVTYSAIPPGKYVFHAQCRTGADDKSIEDLNYPFEIVTPFQKTGWFRLLVILGCILLGVTIQYVINKRKQNRIKLLNRLRSEEQAKIRMRTAEDFHDEVGNKLTRINVLTNVLQSKIGTVTPDVKRIIAQIQDNTTQLYGGTRDILWSLQPANDNLYEILHRIRDFGNELFQDTDIEFSFIGSDEKWRQYKLPMDMSRNLIMIFKEALNNTLKYSGAKHVKLEAQLRNQKILFMNLSDDGKGFDLPNVKKGHGIDNMNVRAARLGGKLYIDSRENKGTFIALRFPVNLSK